jgi:hypothetical protein
LGSLESINPEARVTLSLNGYPFFLIEFGGTYIVIFGLFIYPPTLGLIV